MVINSHGASIIEGKRMLHITDTRLARIAAMADDAFRALQLTVVCPACGDTPHMQNHPTDAVWVMDCTCTSRRLVNAYK